MTKLDFMHAPPGSEMAQQETSALIDRYAPQIPVPPPYVLDQVRRNLERRVALLEEFGALTPEEFRACRHHGHESARFG